MRASTPSTNSGTTSARCSFDIGAGGPASTWCTRTPASTSTSGARPGRQDRVYTSQSTPARARAEESSRTYTFIPPPSPAPGWASGDVCSERTASLRTMGGTLPSASLFPVCLGAGNEHALVLVAERGVHLDESLLLRFGERGIPQDVADEVVFSLAFFENPRPHVERL